MRQTTQLPNLSFRRYPRVRRVGRIGVLVSTLAGLSICTSAWPSYADAQFDSTHIQAFSDGLAFYALAACVVGICVSSAMWAMGSKGQHPGQELTGKKGIILCCTAAFFVGALAPAINWLQDKASVVSQETIPSLSTPTNTGLDPNNPPGATDPGTNANTGAGANTPLDRNNPPGATDSGTGTNTGAGANTPLDRNNPPGATDSGTNTGK